MGQSQSPWAIEGTEVAPRLLELLDMWRHSSRVPSRRDLAIRLGVNDRALRAAVAELRREGHLVIADPEVGGYRFARSQEEVLAFTANLKSRIEALRSLVDVMEREARKQLGHTSTDAYQQALF